MAFLKKIALRLLVFIFIAVLTFGFFWLPFLRISRIEVGDKKFIGAIENVLATYTSGRNNFFLPRNSFFLLSSSEIENALKISDLGVFKIRKRFPNALLVEFRRIEPVFIFCVKQDICFYVDNSGVLSDRAPKFSESPLPVLENHKVVNAELGNTVMSKEEAAFVMEWLALLNMQKMATSKLVLEGEFVKIFLHEGWFLYLSKELQSTKTLYDLTLLLDEKIKENRSKLEYIDLRFENRAFYKLH